MADAMRAIVAKCNELGGINGRKIVLDYYDAAIFNVPVAMQSACDAGTFFLVGEGWSFDSNQEETRLGCNLPAVPGYAVSAAFANGRDMYNAVPNPADQQTGAFYAQIAQLFPEQVKKVAMLAGNYSATQETRDKVVEAAPKFGWQFVSTTLEYNITGESDWTPFVKQLQEAGAEVVGWVGSCLPNLQLFAQAAAANGYTPIITADANHYADTCAAANTDGALDNLYMRLVYVPFEEASVNKATQDFIDLMHEEGGDIALLGAESASAFLLWATAAQSCGQTLTRECTLSYLHDVHDWTGHGLQAPADPGGNNQLLCAMVMRLEGTKYVRASPDEPGTFACDDSWNTPITTTPALAAALLDDNRISQQFSGGAGG
jgi:ABC-type branched-subunit amino acid transport system substrate-binding protein